MDRYVNYNANPKSKRVGDCVVRAISLLLDQAWEYTYCGIVVKGYELYDMPSSNAVWGAYLRSNGCERYPIPNTCPDCYTVKQFCEDHPQGKYLLCLNGHVVAVIDGRYYDTWDSGEEIPIYYWEKKGD